MYWGLIVCLAVFRLVGRRYVYRNSTVKNVVAERAVVQILALLTGFEGRETGFYLFRQLAYARHAGAAVLSADVKIRS